MGSWLSKLVDVLSSLAGSDRHVNIVMLGLDAAGRSRKWFLSISRTNKCTTFHDFKFPNRGWYPNVTRLRNDCDLWNVKRSFNMPFIHWATKIQLQAKCLAHIWHQGIYINHADDIIWVSSILVSKVAQFYWWLAIWFPSNCSSLSKWLNGCQSRGHQQG